MKMKRTIGGVAAATGTGTAAAAAAAAEMVVKSAIVIAAVVVSVQSFSLTSTTSTTRRTATTTATTTATAIATTTSSCRHRHRGMTTSLNMEEPSSSSSSSSSPPPPTPDRRSFLSSLAAGTMTTLLVTASPKPADADSFFDGVTNLLPGGGGGGGGDADGTDNRKDGPSYGSTYGIKEQLIQKQKQQQSQQQPPKPLQERSVRGGGGATTTTATVGRGSGVTSGGGTAGTYSIKEDLLRQKRGYSIKDELVKQGAGGSRVEQIKVIIEERKRKREEEFATMMFEDDDDDVDEEVYGTAAANKNGKNKNKNDVPALFALPSGGGSASGRVSPVGMGTLSRYEDTLAAPGRGGVGVGVRFEFPSDWLQVDRKSGGIQFVDQRNGDKLYVLRTTLPSTDTIETIPSSFFASSIFSPNGGVVRSGNEVSDYRAVDPLPSSGARGGNNINRRRRLTVKYSTVTGNGLRVERKALVDAYQVESDVYMMLASTTAVRFDSDRGGSPERRTLEKIADSFLIAET